MKKINLRVVKKGGAMYKAGNILNFPDGTLQVLKGINRQLFTWEYKGTESIFMLLQLLDKSPNITDIETPFLPYSRQDKGDYDGLFTFLKMISGVLGNSRTLNIHCPTVHCRSIKYNNINVIETPIIVDTDGFDLIVFPDESASKRKFIYENIPTITLQKTRCSQGHPTVIVPKESIKILKNKSKAILVDDICDGGATFISAAKEIRKVFKGELALFTTVAIYSNGLRELKQHFNGGIYYDYKLTLTH